MIYINLLNRISDFSSSSIGDNFNYMFGKSKTLNNLNSLVPISLRQPEAGRIPEAEIKKSHSTEQLAEGPVG